MKRWLRHQQALLDFACSCLWRRRGKSLALLIVYSLLIFLLTSALLFAHALQREAVSALEGTPEIIIQKLTGGRTDLISVDAVDVIRRIRAVRSVQGRLWGSLFDPTAAANYTMLVSPDKSIPAGHAVIGSGVAAARGAIAGDLISFRTADGSRIGFTIASTLSHASALVSADLFLIAETDFRKLFAVPEGRYTDIAVSVRNPREVATVAAKISEALPDCRLITRSDMIRTYQSVFDWRGGILLVLLCGSVFAFCILAWEKASGLSAEERREIGVLRAIGWDSGDIIRLKSMEGALVSLTAC